MNKNLWLQVNSNTKKSEVVKKRLPTWLKHLLFVSTLLATLLIQADKIYAMETVALETAAQSALQQTGGNADTNHLFLPFVTVEHLCSQNAQAKTLMDLIITHTEQQRVKLTCNRTLVEVAEAKATDLATRNYFDHVTPEGIGPNQMVIQAGYPLISSYARTMSANAIESLAAGTTLWSAEGALAQFLNSSLHRDHLLGLTPLFLEQSEIGVGYAYNPEADYSHYWVVLIAEPEE